MDARFGFHEQGQPGRVRVPQAPRRRSSRGLGLLVFVCVAVGLAWTVRSGHKVRKQAAVWAPAQAMSGWHEGAAGYAQAIEEQRRTNRPIFVYLHVDWCPYCSRMDQDTIDSPVLRQFLAGSIAVGVNPERAPADAELAGRLGGRGYPRAFLVAHAGAAPVPIPTLARQENEPLEPVVRKFMAAVQEQTGVPAANSRR